MKNKKQILSAAQKMRKALKKQRQNRNRDVSIVEYYTQKYQKAYSKLLDLLID